MVLAPLLVAAPRRLRGEGAGPRRERRVAEAFIEYVKKMEERSSQPTSGETKNKFEAKLTAKKTAATAEAKDIFNRASDEAEGGSQRNRQAAGGSGAGLRRPRRSKR